MRVNRNAEHRSERDNVRADVPVSPRAVICAHVCHDGINVRERALAGENRREPSRRPSRVGAFVENLVHVFRKRAGVAFGDNENRALPFDEVHANHRHGNVALGNEVERVASAAEVFAVCRAPFSRRHHRIDVLPGRFAGLFHDRLTVYAGCLHVAVECGRAGVDEVHDPVFRVAFHRVAGNAFDGFGRPIRANVGEARRAPRELVEEQLANAVHRVVFRGKRDCFARSVPVKRAVQKRFRHVAVRVVIRPVTLTLEAAANGVEAETFFFAVDRLQIRVPVHHVAEDNRHQNRFAERAFLFFRGKNEVGAIAVRTDFDVFFRPFHGELEFFFVVNFEVHAAAHFRHVNGLDAHAEVAFPERVVEDRSRDTHRATADGEVAFSAERSDRQPGAGEAENFFRDIFRNRGVVRVLHVVSVNRERGNAFLRVAGERGGEVNGARAFRAVEAPNRLRERRVRFKRFRDVAPARRNGERASDVVFAELLVRGGGFCGTADRRVGDNAFDRLPVRVRDVRFDERGGGFRHVHGLFFERFANTEAAAVNRRTNSDSG